MGKFRELYKQMAGGANQAWSEWRSLPSQEIGVSWAQRKAPVKAHRSNRAWCSRGPRKTQVARQADEERVDWQKAGEFRRASLWRDDTTPKNGSPAARQSFHDLWLKFFISSHPKCCRSFLHFPNSSDESHLFPVLKWFLLYSSQWSCAFIPLHLLAWSRHWSPTGSKPCVRNWMVAILRENVSN